MKNISIAVSIAAAFFVAGCGAIDLNTINTLQEQKGTGIKKIYNAPYETVFKIAKSISYHSHCSRSLSIFTDELTGQIFARRHGAYGMQEWMWLIIVEPLDDKKTQLELIYTSILGKKENACFSIDLFNGIEDYLKSKSVGNP